MRGARTRNLVRLTPLPALFGTLMVHGRRDPVAIQSGAMLPGPPLYLPKPPGPAIPLASSCTKCRREETGAPDVPISRCGGCKLTRFCSVECQTADWARHRKICKMVKEVKWFNWEDNA
ncbi:hypothetical protein C8R44DRAFT_302552 [Mycena epipterygia]|nr:hypothetical protein C8R44DRAFT_302552 [Mycena epipterygia]